MTKAQIVPVLSIYGSYLADRLRHQVIDKTTMKQADIIVAVKPVAKAFEELGIRYYIGGSVASSIYGMLRSTQAVDLVKNCKLLKKGFSGSWLVECIPMPRTVQRIREING